MDELFIPERDALETEDEEDETVEDRSTWIAENEDNLNAHADLVAQEEVGTGISVRVTEEEDRELMERLAREGGKSGVVQISLAWDDYNDLDMHVFCPSGERIYFNNRKSECGGELDVDMNVRPKSKTPIENVVWTDEAPDGSTRLGSISIVIIASDEQRKRANSGYVSSPTVKPRNTLVNSPTETLCP